MGGCCKVILAWWSKHGVTCMYQTSLPLFSDSCTIIFPFLYWCILHSCITFIHCCSVAFVYYSFAAVMYHIRYIAFIRCTHSSFMRCTHSSFMRCTYSSFMRCTHLLFMRQILLLAMYHIHGLIVTSLFLPILMYQVELLVPWWGDASR